MALRNDWDDLMGDVEWEDSEVDSGYFDSDNEAGNPGSWPLMYPKNCYCQLRSLFYQTLFLFFQKTKK